jgi:hypothetical protein
VAGDQGDGVVLDHSVYIDRSDDPAGVQEFLQ